MDPEVLRLKAHLDQTRSEMRGIVRGLRPDAIARLVKTCAGGELAALDDREQLLVGMLAVVATFDLLESTD